MGDHIQPVSYTHLDVYKRQLVTTQPPALGPSGPRAFTALREIARALSSALDLDTTLDLIVRQTTEIMGVDSCAIYLLDTDDVTLRLRASTGLALSLIHI